MSCDAIIVHPLFAARGGAPAVTSPPARRRPRRYSLSEVSDDIIVHVLEYLDAQVCVPRWARFEASTAACMLTLDCLERLTL
jgi:hypothetical protein